MKWIVFLRPRAEQDLAEARDWYEQRSSGLGDSFLDSAAEALRELAQNPERHRFYFGKFRRVLFQRFPYKLFFQVIGQRVIIFRVLHAKQNHSRDLT